VISLIEKLIAYMKKSPENRTQVILFVGFFVVPAVGLILLYIIMMAFVIKG
jgi:hypothetical protein